MMPRRIDLATLDAPARAALCQRAAVDLALYEERARPVVERVRREGDAALVACARAFDKVELETSRIRVPEADFALAEDQVGAKVAEAIRFAAANIRALHARQVPPAETRHEVRPGVFGGDLHRPIERVACYVPRGKGSFPSVAMMTAIPAVVAGCPRVVIVTPPGPGGRCDAATLLAARAAGVSEVYLAGGVQGIAAVAYGTETVPACLKVVGPGSPWVQAALRLCADAVEVGPPAGPSESLVLADETADARLCALDLLVESEHGADSTCFLVTPDANLADAVADHVTALWSRLSEVRRAYSQAALTRNGGIVLAKDMDDAVRFANEVAPEHLQIAAASPRRWLERIVNAGEILLGQGTPFSFANYVIGVNAVLPTGGRARAASALGVPDFLKRISIAEVRANGFAALAGPTITLADYEGFEAHALAVRERGG
jgi:histidinol dehydrogenase